MRKWREYAGTPLRLVLGFGFAYHGFPKVFTAEGHETFAGMLSGLGMPAPDALAWTIGGFEFFGGVLLILGAFTALIAALGAIEMAVAGLMVHLPAGFNFMNITGMTPEGPAFGMPGYEVNLLYIAGFLALMLGGAGVPSVDAWRARQRVADDRTADVPPHRIPEPAAGRR